MRKCSDRKKLLILNKMEVVDSSCCGGECEYVAVDDNYENRLLLRKMGLTDSNINKYIMDDMIEISIIAWEYTCANYWSPDTGFYFRGRDSWL